MLCISSASYIKVLRNDLSISRMVYLCYTLTNAEVYHTNNCHLRKCSRENRIVFVAKTCNCVDSLLVHLVVRVVAWECICCEYLFSECISALLNAHLWHVFWTIIFPHTLCEFFPDFITMTLGTIHDFLVLQNTLNKAKSSLLLL